MNIKTFDYEPMDGFAWMTFEGNHGKNYTVQCCLADGPYNPGTGNCLPCEEKIIMSNCGAAEGICGETNREAFKDFGENRCLTMLFDKAREQGMEVVE